MPLTNTPWGEMRQARSAQHTPGNVPRPPRPSYLPPAPPQCSASPLPPVVSTIGKSETSVVYDRIISPDPDIPNPNLTNPNLLTPPSTITANGHVAITTNNNMHEYDDLHTNEENLDMGKHFA